MAFQSEIQKLIKQFTFELNSTTKPIPESKNEASNQTSIIHKFNTIFPKNKTQFKPQESNELIHFLINIFDETSKIPKGTLVKNPILLHFCFHLFFYLISRKQILLLDHFFTEEDILQNQLLSKYKETKHEKMTRFYIIQKYFKILVNSVATAVEEVKNEAYSSFCNDIFCQLKENKMFQFNNDLVEKPLFLMEIITLIRTFTENKPFVVFNSNQSEIYMLMSNLLDWFCQIENNVNQSLSEKCMIKTVKSIRNIVFSKTFALKSELLQKMLNTLNKFSGIKEIVVDSMRIICKASELIDVPINIDQYPMFISISAKTLEIFANDHYIVSLVLHFVNIIVSKDEQFGFLIESVLMDKLLDTFEYFTKKVS